MSTPINYGFWIADLDCKPDYSALWTNVFDFCFYRFGLAFSQFGFDIQFGFGGSEDAASLKSAYDVTRPIQNPKS
jgi:hypothetical protein